MDASPTGDTTGVPVDEQKIGEYTRRQRKQEATDL